MENIFANIPKELSAEVFENIVKNDAIHIERIISKGHTSPESGWYEEQQNEWVILLKGQAMILFENQTTVYLRPGETIPMLLQDALSGASSETRARRNMR